MLHDPMFVDEVNKLIARGPDQRRVGGAARGPEDQAPVRQHPGRVLPRAARGRRLRRRPHGAQPVGQVVDVDVEVPDGRDRRRARPLAGGRGDAGAQRAGGGLRHRPGRPDQPHRHRGARARDAGGGGRGPGQRADLAGRPGGARRHPRAWCWSTPPRSSWRSSARRCGAAPGDASSWRCRHAGPAGGDHGRLPRSGSTGTWSSWRRSPRCWRTARRASACTAPSSCSWTAQTPPTEEEHYRAYRQVLEAMGGRPVTIRTLDLGGDKVPGQAKHETRAEPGDGPAGDPLLPASTGSCSARSCGRCCARRVHGNLRIMFPLICGRQRAARGAQRAGGVPQRSWAARACRWASASRWASWSRRPARR